LNSNDTGDVAFSQAEDALGSMHSRGVKMMEFKTEQEKFWAGTFGNEYIERNQGSDLVAGKKMLLAKALMKTEKFKTMIDFGSNIGMNLRAMDALDSEVELSAIEINDKAVSELKKLPKVKVYHQSILEFTPDYPRDFVMITGVLIHINPEFLKKAYTALYQTSKRYIYLCESYNPTPVEIDYRGHKGRYYKRDFAGEMMDMFPDLKLVDYGFDYHRDQRTLGGDGNWFLMEKTPQR
jgi:spore coat polysaccharide biosynthesis protein SpsF